MSRLIESEHPIGCIASSALMVGSGESGQLRPVQS